MIRIPAALMALAVLVAQKAPPAVPLVDRVPLPPGYGSEQDTESDGSTSFFLAADVKGHILRRYVQAGDDKTAVPDIAAFYAGFVRDLGGVVVGDRFNNVSGRLDGRIPGTQPLWLHIEMSDEGGVIDVLVLDERSPAPRDIPVEEAGVPGTWLAGAGTAGIAEKLAPLLQPYRGWEWRLVAEASNRLRLFGLARSQACAACPIVTDTREVTVATFDTQAGRVVVDIPSRHASGEVSLYQQQLIEKIVAARFADVVK